MIPRQLNPNREKILMMFILFTISVSVVYFYIYRAQQIYRNEWWSSTRCISELTSLKYQLDVVTEYKDRIDKLLTETQQSHVADKARFKDIMESCIAMKQQVIICQNQFEDLQVQCKKIREEYDNVNKQLEKMKYVE